MRSNLFWLSDEQWQRIEPHLPKDVRGKERVDDRRVISGILHILKSGCRWCDCPPEYGPPTTIVSFSKKSAERIAGLNNEAERLKADNLSLQTVLLPRHVGLIGIDEQPKAKAWFAGFDRWSGIKILIQVVPGDPEAQNIANEIAIVLSKFGWLPEFINEARSGISLNLSEGITIYSPSSYKAWDPQDPAQQLYAKLSQAAIALATALTRAGLGVGSYPVSGSRGLGIVVDFPPDSEGEAHNPYRNFSPKLDGVYLQVGSRPVGATVEWIKRGRPDSLGNKAGAGTVENTK